MSLQWSNDLVVHWISNLEDLSSKPLRGSKVNSAFHLSEVHQMSTRYSLRRGGQK